MDTTSVTPTTILEVSADSETSSPLDKHLIALSNGINNFERYLCNLEMGEIESYYTACALKNLMVKNLGGDFRLAIENYKGWNRIGAEGKEAFDKMINSIFGEPGSVLVGKPINNTDINYVGELDDVFSDFESYKQRSVTIKDKSGRTLSGNLLELNEDLGIKIRLKSPVTVQGVAISDVYIQKNNISIFRLNSGNELHTGFMWGNHQTKQEPINPNRLAGSENGVLVDAHLKAFDAYKEQVLNNERLTILNEIDQRIAQQGQVISLAENLQIGVYNSQNSTKIELPIGSNDRRSQNGRTLEFGNGYKLELPEGSRSRDYDPVRGTMILETQNQDGIFVTLPDGKKVSLSEILSPKEA